MKVLTSVIFILLLLFSCQEEVVSKRIEKGIINKKGLYITENYKIIVKEFSNGSLVYAFSDKKNNLIFQQNILEAFSNYSFWCLYFDKNESLWVYNSDYQSTDVWVKEGTSSNYEKKDYCDLSLKMPTEFDKKIKDNTNNICEHGL